VAPAFIKPVFIFWRTLVRPLADESQSRAFCLCEVSTFHLIAGASAVSIFLWLLIVLVA
tara:strand:- start:960 stop:1136 length:177 start_codon:yes stop_codon:yes gene_type:complete